MIQWIISSILLFVFGIAVLVYPGIVDYTNTGNWYFDLSRFLNDYPQLRYPFGIVSIIIGLAGFLLIFVHYKRKNTAFVIQQSGDGDYGNPSLSFPKLFIGSQEPLLYENVASQAINEQLILDLDKKKIRRFYENLKNRKRIAFIGVALFPYIVYAGYIVGNAGQKIIYFHYDRNKAKSKWVRFGFKNHNDLTIKDIINPSSRETVIAVSVSYQIDRAIVQSQFTSQKIVYLDALKLGTETIDNAKTLKLMADKIRRTINDESGDNRSITLLLSCPAELCFAIGQRLCSPGLPSIKVYNFNRKTEIKWDWHISLD